jgi:hypothetical protein
MNTLVVYLAGIVRYGVIVRIAGQVSCMLLIPETRQATSYKLRSCGVPVRARQVRGCGRVETKPGRGGEPGRTSHPQPSSVDIPDPAFSTLHCLASDCGKQAEEKEKKGTFYFINKVECPLFAPRAIRHLHCRPVRITG